MQISYNVADWADHYQKSNVRPSSVDDAIDLMRESNIKLSELAMLLIIGRELGIVKDATLPSNKISNLTGTALHLSHRRSRQTVKVQIAGRDVDVPRFVANSTVEDGVQSGYQYTVPNGNPDTTVVDYNNPAAADRAIAYLMTNVLGRIRDRLSLVALNKPDHVKGVAAELKRSIDKIVAELK